MFRRSHLKVRAGTTVSRVPEDPREIRGFEKYTFIKSWKFGAIKPILTIIPTFHPRERGTEKMR